MTEEEKQSRLAFSGGLRDLAEHASEMEMRQSISRMYYALYHLAAVLLGKQYRNHDHVAPKLEPIDAEMAKGFDKLREARSKADYDHGWVSRDFKSHKLFQERFIELMNTGGEVYERMIYLIGKAPE